MKRKISEVEANFLRLLRHYFRNQPQVKTENSKIFAKEVMRISQEIFHSPQPVNQIVGPVVSTTTVSAWLRMTRQGIGKAVRQERLLAVQIGHKWFYPSWQLNEEHTLHPAIVKLSRSLPKEYGGVEKAAWFYQPNEHLSGKAPFELLHKEAALPLLQVAAKKADPEMTVPLHVLPNQLG